MKVQGLNLQDASWATTKYRNITNTSEAMRQAREKMATAPRDEYIPSGHNYDDDGNFIANEEIFIVNDKKFIVNEVAEDGTLLPLIDTAKLDVPAFMGKNNIQKLKSDSEFLSKNEKFVEFYFLHVAHENDGLDGMADRLQERLDEIDNDTDLTVEEKSLLRSVWKEGFTNAVGFHLGTVDFGEAMKKGSVKDVGSAGEFIRKMANDITGSDFSPEIKNLIFEGLDKMITGATLGHFLIWQRPVFLGGDPRNFVYMQQPQASDVKFLHNIVTEERSKMKN